MTPHARGQAATPPVEAPHARPRLLRLLTCALPYALAAVLAFAVLLSFGLGREGGAARLLTGPDDFMRVVQVLDWIDGQGWNDMVQRRLNPPAGVDMHWSRLADLPLAAVITLAEPWLGRARAVDLAVVVAPPLLGGVLVALFLWAAVPLIPNQAGAFPAAVLTTPALVVPLLQTLPGRVDHHGLQLVLTAAGIGFLMRCLLSRRPWTAVGLGVTGGVSLAVGLEPLPFLGAATVILCLAWVLRSGSAAKALTCFGAALAATSLVFLFLTLPPAAWATVACDRLSLPHIALAGTVLAAGAGAHALGRLRPKAGWPLRLATVAAVGMAGLAWVAGAYPQCAGSPHSSFSHDIRFWLDHVVEARSLVDLFLQEPGTAVAAVSLPLAALVAVGWSWTRASDQTDSRWPGMALLVLSGVALVAWQNRGVAYAGLVASIALVPLVSVVNGQVDGLERVLARIGLRICIPLLLMLAVALPPRLLPGSTRAAETGNNPECEVLPVLQALNDPAGLGASVRTIAAPIDVGPRILLFTPHKVLAASYHRNVEGLTHNRRIFAGAEDEALATIKARGVDAILFCSRNKAGPGYKGQPVFLDDRLASGNPPWWLLPVTARDGTALYRVHPDVIQAGSGSAARLWMPSRWR